MQPEPPQQLLLDRFFAHALRRDYRNNEVIISAGDYSTELYYLVHGSVSVQYEDKDGHEIILAYLHEGDFFGEIGMFDERRERSAWVRSRGEAEVAHLSYDGLRELTRAEPHVVFEMLSQLAVRVRNTSRKASDLAFTDVAGRVARVLLELTAQPEAVPHERGTKLTVTRQELSRLAGCSREMVSRVLRVLEERHVVATEGRSLIVFEHGKDA